MTQYREVKRKAEVGERIKIVEPFYTLRYNRYTVGDEFVVTSLYSSGVNSDEQRFVHDEYVVLEPVTASETPTTATIDEFRELQRKVADLETQLRVAREDIVLIEEGASADIIRLEAAVFPSKWRR